MQTQRVVLVAAVVVVMVAGVAFVDRAWPTPSQPGPIQVAVTEADIEAIVKAVGGEDVATFHLFRGCILRDDLQVRPEVVQQLAGRGGHRLDRLLQRVARDPDLARSAARRTGGPSSSRRPGSTSRSASSGSTFRSRSATATSSSSTCPATRSSGSTRRTGRTIARNVAEGLEPAASGAARSLRGKRRGLQPGPRSRESRAGRAELAPLAGLKVFSAQCGWQNLSRLGGPHFMACRKNPGAAAAARGARGPARAHGAGRDHRRPQHSGGLRRGVPRLTTRPRWS